MQRKIRVKAGILLSISKHLCWKKIILRRKNLVVKNQLPAGFAVFRQGRRRGKKRSRRSQRETSKLLFENNTRSLLYIIKIHLYEFTEVKIALKGQVTRAITSLCWPVVEGAAHETSHEVRVRDRSGVYAGRRSLHQPQPRNTLHRWYFTAPCFRRTGTLNF